MLGWLEISSHTWTEGNAMFWHKAKADKQLDSWRTCVCDTTGFGQQKASQGAAPTRILVLVLLATWVVEHFNAAARL